MTGYGDLYRIRLEYELDKSTWTVLTEYGMDIGNADYAVRILNSFLWHHLPKYGAELTQINSNTFTSSYNPVKRSTENPYPID